MLKVSTFKKYFGVMGLSLVLMSSFFTNGALASVVDGTNPVQATTNAAAYSKYVSLRSTELKNPSTHYWYDDGMYSGWLNVTQVVSEPGSGVADYFVLGGYVYCYQRCQVSSINKVDK